MPDFRKIHKIPVPRLGGVSFLPILVISMGLTIGILFRFHPVNIFFSQADVFNMLFLIVGMTMLYFLGLYDDIIGIQYRYKFVVQILCSAILPISGIYINNLYGLFGIYAIPVYISVPLTMFIVVYITNAINLIDGIDGLASGLCCISLCVLTFIEIHTRQYIYAIPDLAVLGILIPFWFYNVFGNIQRHHKMFMGDTGSLTLGFLISFLIIHLSKSDVVDSTPDLYNMVIAFTSLFVPLFDVVRVVFHRMRERKPLFLPDKNHIHHKLLSTGMRVRYVMLTIISISLFFILLNLLMLSHISITWILITDIIIWIAFHLFIDYKMYQRGLVLKAIKNQEQQKI